MGHAAFHQDHRFYLLRALELAKSRRGYCAPNPAVGALIVKEGGILAEGVHPGCGEPHAEVMAFKALHNGAQAAGATMYISLEPCAHQGRTPPCTEAILAAGIQRVVYAYRDPNPVVAGRGHAELKAAGLEVLAVPLPEIDEFYQSYTFWLHTQKPWLRAKLAMSLDGKIAGPGGQRVTITGPKLKEHTYRCRRHSDAILTSATTIRNDDPFLDIRLENVIENKRLYILDRRLQILQTAAIWQNTQPITVFYSALYSDKLSDMPQRQGIDYIAISEQNDQLNLTEVLVQMGSDGVHDCWVEAGGKLLSSLLSANLVQELQLITAPIWLGSSAQSAFDDNQLNIRDFIFKRYFQIGEDVVCEMRKQPSKSVEEKTCSAD